MNSSKPKTKKPTIAGMFLWDVEIEYQGDGYLNRKDRRTLKIATRHKTITEAQKKTKAHLRAFRYDYPQAKIVGIAYDGFVDA